VLTHRILYVQDVMHIGADVGKITLAARYGPELGEYMMHCHNNVHEDNDMFRAFMVSGDAAHGPFVFLVLRSIFATPLQIGAGDATHLLVTTFK
jgi:Multicopper oxidase